MSRSIDLPTGPTPDILPRVPLERSFVQTNTMARKIQERERKLAATKKLSLDR